MVAGILHDVVDDTCESLRSIELEFGEDVAKLVARVSRLSYINQVLNLLVTIEIAVSFLMKFSFYFLPRSLCLPALLPSY